MLCLPLYVESTANTASAQQPAQALHSYAH